MAVTARVDLHPDASMSALLKKEFGEWLRKTAKLNSKENNSDKVVIVLPSQARTLSPRFVIGFLGPSLQRENNNIELFKRKYSFEGTEGQISQIYRALEEHLAPIAQQKVAS